MSNNPLSVRRLLIIGIISHGASHPNSDLDLVVIVSQIHIQAVFWFTVQLLVLSGSQVTSRL
jgi:predicted nucleotidyltransferase